MSINLPSVDPTVRDKLELRRSQQLEFLLTVLSSINESNINTDIIYPLFRNNLDLLDLDIIEVLRNLFNITFSESNQIKQKLIAVDILNLGNRIQQFPLGNKAVNMELSIECYALALKILTIREDPKNWSSIQNNLAAAYRDRIRGDRSDNLERSIKGYESALQVYTLKDFPIQWAMTQNNLANAYGDRIKGDRTENLEQSIKCCQLALKVRTQTDFPLDWAMTQNNLAAAYNNRIKGDRADNLEQSINGYKSALQVYTLKDFPVDWAMIQNNLANTHSDRIKGDRVDNLEQSINGYKSALQVYTLKDFPVDWAMIQNNLAIAYSKRVRGDRSDNLEQSINGYESALQVRTKTDFPIQWATTNNNLANAYADRSKGDRIENLEKSVKHYKSALEVFTEDSAPHDWVKIQVDLAQFSIEKLQNHQVAIEHLQLAYRQLLANNNDTGLLAQIMLELARCFHQTGCLEQSKMYFKDSIRLYRRLEQPTQVAAATSALGNLELQMGLIDDARLHLQTALEFYQAAGNPERVESIQELQQYLPVTSGASGS